MILKMPTLKDKCNKYELSLYYFGISMLTAMSVAYVSCLAAVACSDICSLLLGYFFRVFAMCLLVAC
jgi:hypothetical protein